MVRGTQDVFDEEAPSTIGFSFQKLQKQTEDNHPICLFIWDTAGQEMYRSMLKMYYRGVHCALITYDISSRDSFESVQHWLEDVREK